MSVRAVTPRITALSGHVQIHCWDCAGDCCNYDTFTDALATGEDIYDPEWPDKPLRLGRVGRSLTDANPRGGHRPGS